MQLFKCFTSGPLDPGFPTEFNSTLPKGVFHWAQARFLAVVHGQRSEKWQPTIKGTIFTITKISVI